jgi:hypothetical protein
MYLSARPHDMEMGGQMPASQPLTNEGDEDAPRDRGRDGDSKASNQSINTDHSEAKVVADKSANLSNSRLGMISQTQGDSTSHPYHFI